MLQGNIPFEENEYMWELKWITPLSKDVINLMEKMLERNYTKRIGLQSVKAHQWLSKDFCSKPNSYSKDETRSGIHS